MTLSATSTSPSKDLTVDEWWAAINASGEFPNLTKMASSLLTCFHGPAVESSFSEMGNIMDSKSSKMNVETLSSIQTVRYGLKSGKKSAVECFTRKNPRFTPVNHNMCRLMRSSAKRHKAAQKKKREEEDEKRVQLSVSKQKEVSRQKAKILNAEAEKSSRRAHKLLMHSRLVKLTEQRKQKLSRSSTGKPLHHITSEANDVSSSPMLSHDPVCTSSHVSAVFPFLSQDKS